MTERTCVIDGCERPVRSTNAQHCELHYYRLRRKGDPGPVEPRKTYKVCQLEGCSRPHNGHGLCGLHSQRLLRTGDVEGLRGLARGDRHHWWTGDVPTYPAQHFRLRHLLGPARDRTCSQCGQRAAHWAYDHSDPNEIPASDKWPVYSVDPRHYQPMCNRCHRLFDIEHAHLKEL